MGLKELMLEEIELDFKWLPKFKTTDDILPYQNIIGQDTAMKELVNGVMIKKKNFNIFICGDRGTGKKYFAQRLINEIASKENDPSDWCYVYDFKNPTSPTYLKLNTGTAEEFKCDTENLLTDILNDMPDFITSKDYYDYKNKVTERYQEKIIETTEDLYLKAQSKSFNVRTSGEGFAFVPLRNGDEMTEKEYNDLTREERDTININVSELKGIAIDIIKEIKKFKISMENELDDLLREHSKVEIEKRLDKIKQKYEYNEMVLEYLEALQNDLIENINEIMDVDNNDSIEIIMKRYSVNILVKNKTGGGSPVVLVDSPDYQTLFGKIEYENKGLGLSTDFTLIRSGKIHEANGGYLIIDAENLIRSFGSYEGLKRQLKTGKITIDNFKGTLDILPVMSITPKEIPLDVKVILLGSQELYYILYNYDEDFGELFKIKCEFDYRIPCDEENGVKVLGAISNYCKKNGIKPVEYEGVIEILKYLLRVSGDKKYFSSSLIKIEEIIDRAETFSLSAKENFISKDSVTLSIDSIFNKGEKTKKYILDMYSDGKYLFNLSSYKIGEINGLSVLDMGDNIVGKQNKITVTTFAGHQGVINIEREANMSGNIHNKGIMILSGYLGENFGQEIILSFNASICFEQLYGAIEGDSASAAELIALISSLGDIPIYQGIGVTGSVNQKGEIQPVGCINEKIEGFYDICKLKGLDGTHGVIIPHLNVDELLLRDDIIESIKEKKFKVHSVKRIEDCFKLICQDDLRKQDNVYGVIKDRIIDKLKRYNAVLNTVESRNK